MMCTQGRQSIYALVASCLLASCATHSSFDDAPAIPAHGVVGIGDAQLRPEFWIARDRGAKKIVLESQAIADQNARLLQLDPSVHDLEKLPPTLSGAEVRAWIGKLSQYPDEALF